jgi:hypothetical protein
MADAPVVDAPTEPVVEPKTEKEDKKPALDVNRPLSQQVDKIVDLMPEEKEDDKPDEKKPAETSETVEEKKKDDPNQEEDTSDSDPTEAEPENNLPEPDEINVEPKELPTWQKYILDNLPNIQTIGHVGNGKDKLYTVKRVEDLPENFEFSDKRSELAFSAALASQEVNARDLLKQYQADEQQQQYLAFQNQEALDIQSDIKALQKEGIIAKFEHDEDEAEFNSDPAGQEANAIYDLYKKTNESYLREGRTYRISYQDAAYKYLGMKSRQAPPKNESKQERDKVAGQVSAPSSARPASGKKAMPAGSTRQDVLRAYKLWRI